jgi:hypothetical protein
MIKTILILCPIEKFLLVINLNPLLAEKVRINNLRTPPLKSIKETTQMELKRLTPYQVKISPLLRKLINMIVRIIN